MDSVIDIIIVNWNTAALLQKCLDSIQKHVLGIEYNITVVDNASSDDSVMMLRTGFPQVDLIQNRENLGFAKANNIAMDRSKGKYLFLLNSDTMIKDNILQGITLYMENHPHVGMLGCRLELPNGCRQVGDAGYEPTAVTAFNFSFFLSRLFPRRCHGLFLNDNSETIVDVDWVSGAALIVRRDTLNDAGPLAENYFMYAEDIEWGIRIKRHGWKVQYYPAATVTHYLGGSLTGAVSTSWIENLFLYVKRTQTMWHYRLFVVIMSLGFLIRILLYKTYLCISHDEAVQKKYLSISAAFRRSLLYIGT